MPTPPSEHRYPCENCGASLQFAPGQNMLVCPYCGHRQSISPGAARAPGRQASGGPWGDDALLRTEMAELFPADISGILYELDPEPAHYLLGLLDKSVGAEIIAKLAPTDRPRLLKAFTSEELAPLINLMDSDDAVDLLNEQPIQVREEVIGLLEDREQARFILDLLHYEDGVAGSLMQKELIKINVNLTVNACIDILVTSVRRVMRLALENRAPIDTNEWATISDPHRIPEQRKRVVRSPNR